LGQWRSSSRLLLLLLLLRDAEDNDDADVGTPSSLEMFPRNIHQPET